jgi:hypothetical protein
MIDGIEGVKPIPTINKAHRPVTAISVASPPKREVFGR